MHITDYIIQVVASFVGTLGFGVLFNTKGKKLVLVSLGGMLSWIVYLVSNMFLQNEVLCCLISSIVTSIYSEILARVLKTPVTTFNISCLIPLIPGSALYYSIKYALGGDLPSFISRASSTLSIAAALSVGVILVNTVARHIHKLKPIKKP